MSVASPSKSRTPRNPADEAFVLALALFAPEINANDRGIKLIRRAVALVQARAEIAERDLDAARERIALLKAENAVLRGQAREAA
jgi:hypothetical protein